jgi:hypothetical protein
MYQFLVFYAGRACSAGIHTHSSRSLRKEGLFSTINQLGICNCQRKFLIPFRAEEQLGMAYPLVKNGLDQLSFDPVIAGNISKAHYGLLKGKFKFFLVMKVVASGCEVSLAMTTGLVVWVASSLRSS